MSVMNSDKAREIWARIVDSISVLNTWKLQTVRGRYEKRSIEIPEHSTSSYVTGECDGYQYQAN